MQLCGAARGGSLAAPRGSLPRCEPPRACPAPRRSRCAAPLAAAGASWEDEAWDVSPQRPDASLRRSSASPDDAPASASAAYPPDRGLGRRRGGVAASAAASAAARAADAQAEEEAAWERRLAAVEGERTKAAQDRLMLRSSKLLETRRAAAERYRQESARADRMRALREYAQLSLEADADAAADARDAARRGEAPPPALRRGGMTSYDASYYAPEPRWEDAAARRAAEAPQRRRSGYGGGGMARRGDDGGVFGAAAGFLGGWQQRPQRRWEEEEEEQERASRRFGSGGGLETDAPGLPWGRDDVVPVQFAAPRRQPRWDAEEEASRAPQRPRGAPLPRAEEQRLREQPPPERRPPPPPQRRAPPPRDDGYGRDAWDALAGDAPQRRAQDDGW